jgi:hypothetical protein
MTRTVSGLLNTPRSRDGGMGFALTGRMNLARFRPSSRNPHKSVCDMQFNQNVGGAQRQQSGTKINWFLFAGRN